MKLKECEDCHEKKRMKWMFRIHKHYICNRCYRKSTSISAILKSNKEAREWRHRKFRRPFTSLEEKVLWRLYEDKHISKSEMEERMRNLKSSVMRNNTLEWIKDKAKKPDFQEEFKKLTEKE